MNIIVVVPLTKIIIFIGLPSTSCATRGCNENVTFDVINYLLG